MKTDDAFHAITTLIIAQTESGTNQGSGFFYQLLADKEKPLGEPEWRRIQDTWLVTNRHVLLGMDENAEDLPASLRFHLRKIERDTLVWEPVELKSADLLERARFHPNPHIDVCVINVLDLLTNKMKQGASTYMSWCPVNGEQFPGKGEISVEVADDAVVVGYPRGFYDDVNLFPIVKSGIIASRWGANFKGSPCFLIDAKLFPGSSGSIVVSQPQRFAVIDGQLKWNPDKQFAFLGIFSGEPFTAGQPVEVEGMTITPKSGFNLGIVWYGSLIEEIINHGIPYAESVEP